jgi:hypothetical protein
MMTTENRRPFYDGALTNESAIPARCWVLPLYHDERVPADEDECEYAIRSEGRYAK